MKGIFGKLLLCVNFIQRFAWNKVDIVYYLSRVGNPSVLEGINI